MKKWISLCLMLALFTAFAPARADVLWEPDNRFYRAHAEECTSHSRVYFANGPEGNVTLYSAPDSIFPVAQVENGTRLWISFLYEDWGCTDSEDRPGWCPLNQLVPIYDSISFAEEYGAQFRVYAGEFTGYDGPAEGITFWSYPGAPEPVMCWQDGDEILEPLTEADTFTQVFTDEEGFRWGYCNYLYGIRNFWMCFDEPTKTDHAIRAIPDYNLTPAKKVLFPVSLWIPTALVLTVVGVTAGLLCGLRYKKRRTDKASET